MPLMTWNSKYSVGVKILDDHHESLMEILNEFHAAMLCGRGRMAAGSLLKRLRSLAHEHFSVEEKLMATARFPNLTQHREHHEEMLQQVEEFVARHESGERGMYIELLRFLYKCLRSHVMQHDREYVQHMAARGIT